MSRVAWRPYLPFLFLLAWLVAIKLALLGGPPAFRSPSQAAVFAWPFLAGLAAAGLLGAWLARRAGLPEAWGGDVRARDRFLLPALAGLALGALLLLTDRAWGWTAAEAAAHGLPSIHIPWPASLLIYPGGAIIVCTLYYLLPIPLLTWPLGRLLRRPAVAARVFWPVAVLCAAIEPLTQDLTPGMRAVGAVMPVVFAIDFAANLAQVAFFRRAGFLAPVVLRIAFYLVWHVVPSLALR